MSAVKLQNKRAPRLQADMKISGYASLFGQADMSGDVVMRAASNTALRGI